MQHLEVLPRSQIKLCIWMPPSFWVVRFGYIHCSLPQFLVYWGRKSSHMKWGEVMTVWLGKDWDLGNWAGAGIKQFRHMLCGKWYLRSVAHLSAAGQLLLFTHHLIVLSSNNWDWIQTASYFADELWGYFFTEPFRRPFLCCLCCTRVTLCHTGQ